MRSKRLEEDIGGNLVYRYAGIASKVKKIKNE